VASKTSIEWTATVHADGTVTPGATWSPIRFRVKQDAAQIARAKGYTSLVQIAEKMAGHVGPHCEHTSPGCERCYSDTNNHRCLPSNGTGLPFDRRSRDLVDIFLDEKILLQPLKWRTPRKIFPANQTDWAADFVPDEMMDRMLAVAALTPWNTYQFLTKRAARLPAYFLDDQESPYYRTCTRVENVARLIACELGLDQDQSMGDWPLENCQIGFSAEDQPNFDARWQHMRKLAAAGWFVWCSYEPALGPVDVSAALKSGLRWLVVGGESGPGARPFDIEWARQTIRQCKAAGVACFVKQLGAKPMYPRNTILHPPQSRIFLLHDKKGGDWDEWNEDLRVREFPT